MRFKVRCSSNRENLDQMLSCLRRHKGKLFLLGAAVAGSYVGGRWLLNKAAELQEKRHASEVEGNRLWRHYENNRQACLTAVMSLLPRLREAVQSQLNAESITAELRTKSSGKVTLWENLKVICFARVVVSVYVCCAVSAMLRVQLSVLGAGLFLQHREQCSGDSATVQRQYLATVQYLIGEGLQQMVTQVRQATERVLVSYSLKHQLSAEGVVQLLTEIRSLSASRGAGTEAIEQTSFLVQYLLPKQQLLETAGETAHLAAATRDIVESAEFSEVLEGSVDRGFSLLSRQLADVHHSAAQSETTLPVARVIPLVADVFDVLFSSQHNSLVQEVGSSPELHKLSQNIFEAFSQLS